MITSPLLEAHAQEENSVNFTFTETNGSFLGSECKVEETARMRLKLRRSFRNCLNGDRVCFRFAHTEKYVWLPNAGNEKFGL